LKFQVSFIFRLYRSKQGLFLSAVSLGVLIIRMIFFLAELIRIMKLMMGITVSGTGNLRFSITVISN